MKNFIVVILTLLCTSAYSQTQSSQTLSIDSTQVCVLKTTMGEMVFKFYDEDAPNTSANFRSIVKTGFYDGKDFYRVVKGHVIQAGGMQGEAKIKAEFNSRPHIAGTVGLARGGDPDSGGSTFYICHAPRPHLDGKYTVFGQLVYGYDVLDNIGNVEVEERFSGETAFHRPLKPVTIIKATIEMRVLK